MQKWEHTLFVIARGTPSFVGLEVKAISSSRSWEPHLGEVLNKYSNEGWELVSATPVSDHVGDGVAGTTTALYLFFKRLKG